jgi:hypothetical protein
MGIGSVTASGDREAGKAPARASAVRSRAAGPLHGFGDTLPVASNAAEAGARNGRVDEVISPRRDGRRAGGRGRR